MNVSDLNLIILIAGHLAFYSLLSLLFCGIPIMLLSYEKVENAFGIEKNVLSTALLLLIFIFYTSFGINVFTVFNLLVFGVTFHFIPKWLIKTNLHKKALPVSGMIIVLASLSFYFMWTLTTITVHSESGGYALNVLYELGVSTWREAFFKFYLPYLFRISAFFVYGLINLEVGHVIANKASKRSIWLLKLLVILFLSLVSAEVVHSLIFGRRLVV